MLSAADLAGLLKEGMSIARVNCGHDHAPEWSSIINKIEEARKMTGIDCKIYMDLSGPKIRFQSLPESAGRIKLKNGETIKIAHKKEGMEAAHFTVTAPKAFLNAKKGDRLLINDGKIAGTILNTGKGFIEAKVAHRYKKSLWIKVHDGINLPDSLPFLTLPPLSETDIRESGFIFRSADLVGLSFAHSKEDLITLKNLMIEKAGRILPIAAKIETEYAVKNMPSIIAEGLKNPGFGIMLARGDLAAETGFEKLGRLQNDIMEICHHSQTPLIYATEVLNSLAKTGMPSRPEMTDVYFSQKTACTMLNKGPFIKEAVRMLKEAGADRKNQLAFFEQDLSDKN
nr:pyruvate kinase [Metabacillus mangrovi]